VVRLTDARIRWRAVAYRVENVRTLGSHSATPSGATPSPFCATTTTHASLPDARGRRCPLFGVERMWLSGNQNDANDPPADILFGAFVILSKSGLRWKQPGPLLVNPAASRRLLAVALGMITAVVTAHRMRPCRTGASRGNPGNQKREGSSYK
jgi:hypothetical protein